METAEESAGAHAHDRRDFLRRVGIGAALVGGWVTPQVVMARPAWACTPINRFLQIDACSCTAETTDTPSSPEPSTCVPSGWVNGRNDGISFTCPGGDTCLGGTYTVTTSGCTITEATAVRFCDNLSGGAQYACINGTISGNQVTFPALSPGNPEGCIYLTYRIKLSCC